MVEPEGNCPSGKFLSRVLNGLHRLEYRQVPELLIFAMIGAPGVAACSKDFVGGRVIARDAAIGLDAALVLKRQGAGLAGLACSRCGLGERRNPRPIVGFILRPAGPVERPPLFELGEGAADVGRATGFDAAQVGNEQPLAGRRGDRCANDLPERLERSIESPTLHFGQRAGTGGFDGLAYVLEFRLAQVMELHAERSETSARGAVVAVGVTNTRLAVFIGPAPKGREFRDRCSTPALP